MVKSKQHGKFIVFEGIDGSGSSTQAEMLLDHFRANQIPAILSPEPSNGIFGNLCREILKGRLDLKQPDSSFNTQMAHLFASDRHDHLYNRIDGVLMHLSKGVHVISTRYYFSSLAYNGTTPDEIDTVKRLNADFPDPDMLFYADIPVDVALSRIEARGKHIEIFESRQKLLAAKKRYSQAIAEYESPITILDATRPIIGINRRVIEVVNSMTK